MFRYLCVLLLLGALVGSCSVDRTEYRQVACSFAEQLNRCLTEPTEPNYKRLFGFCSAYTYSLAQNPIWSKRIVPQGPFRYTFVLDSLSQDKMRAYVWFSNGLQKIETIPGVAPQAQRDIYCIELRQSFKGWVVDMPLF